MKTTNKKAMVVLAAMTAISSTAFAMGSNIGHNNVSDGDYGLVFGSNNKAETHATSSLTFGDGNTVKQPNSMAFGQGNTSDGENSFVGGDKAKAIGRDTFAFGSSAEALTEYTIAIGSQARTIGYNTLAIGNGATVSGQSSVAIGRTNNVTGEDSVAIGANNGTVSAGQSVIVGYNNKVIGADPEQIIVGSNSKTNGQGAIVVGTHAEATATDAMAIGNNTVADQANSVAIGTNSTTDAVVSTDHIYINGKKFDFAGGTADSTISVGATNKAGAGGVADYKRTITNVAAGRIDDNSTDAVNGSQLNAVINSLNFTTVADGKNTTVAETTNIDGGKEFSVNVNKDLYDMNSANFGATAEPVRSVVDKEKVHFFNDNTSTNTKVDASGISLENTDTLDTASYTMNGMTADSNGKRVEFTTNNITVGNQQIHDVTAGTKDTDAVNVSQLNKVNNALNGVKQNVAANTADIRAIEHTALDHEGRITVLESENKNIKGAISNNSKLIDKNTKDIAKNTSDIKVLDNKIDSVSRNVLERANHYTDLQVNKGVAKASALAGLKFLDYNPKDKWSFAASVGHYRNANAVAVGAAYQPNENTMIHGGITVDGKVAYNLGLSFKTGGQKQVTRQELEEQIRQLENNNIRMQEELNEIRSMLEKK